MEIFKDYGFKNIHKQIRNKVEQLGIQVVKKQSLIKQKFMEFPENQIFDTIITAYYNWIKSIETKQEEYRKMKKSE